MGATLSRLNPLDFDLDDVDFFRRDPVFTSFDLDGVVEYIARAKPKAVWCSLVPAFPWRQASPTEPRHRLVR